MTVFFEKYPIVEFWGNYHTSLAIHRHAQGYLHGVLDFILASKTTLARLGNSAAAQAHLSASGVSIF